MELKEKLFPATLMPDSDWWHTLWPDPVATITALGIRDGMNVVDLCCGDGYFTAAIARQIGTGYVVGFDLDPVMLEQAKSVCRNMRFPRFLVFQGAVFMLLVSPSAEQ